MRSFISSVILKTEVELAGSFWVVKDEAIATGKSVGDELNRKAIVTLDTSVKRNIEIITPITL
jgi:hypothetical protein